MGRSSAIRRIEAVLMHQAAVNAAPRTGQLKSAAGVSRRARPRRECRAVGIFLADPWLVERNVHTVGGQVESQATGLLMQLDYDALFVLEIGDGAALND